MGVRRMTGTPWHVERYARDEGDERRHRCVYYRKSDAHCSQYSGKCRGSAHCPYYREYDPEEEAEPASKPATEKKMSDWEAKRLFPVGCRVKHKSYGAGTVKKVGEAWRGKPTLDIVNFTHDQLPWQICLDDEIIPYGLIFQEDLYAVFSVIHSAKSKSGNMVSNNASRGVSGKVSMISPFPWICRVMRLSHSL